MTSEYQEELSALCHKDKPINPLSIQAIIIADWTPRVEEWLYAHHFTPLYQSYTHNAWEQAGVVWQIIALSKQPYPRDFIRSLVLDNRLADIDIKSFIAPLCVPHCTNIEFIV